MPLVYNRIVLHSRVAGFPRGLRNRMHKIARAVFLGGFVGPDELCPKCLIPLNRLHELVGHANGIVRVLVLNRIPRGVI